MIDVANQLKDVVNGFLGSRSALIIWNHTGAPGKWSNKQIIGHLIDSAHINLQRLVRCTYEECFKLVYFQDEWVQVQHYNDADIFELLQLWRLINMQIVRVLVNYPPNRISITCDNGRHEVSFVTVEFLANDYIAHIRHHLDQLK
ncbi:DinB family protein [Mucilaginibacter terrenus]|uniref:DinB family protein n=1 Tax=Mucilaginibacter terrenus TaxID=2482727 RepID=A0A3E2NUW2_9SPHI|nr:DinB family protein [Mucilaginibacter terrenus]RFZ84640.1 DinB family protein [Mucilaginibacter terrenus]